MTTATSATKPAQENPFTAEKVSLYMQKYSPLLKQNIIFSAISMNQEFYFAALQRAIMVYNIQEIDEYYAQMEPSKKSSIITSREQLIKDMDTLDKRDYEIAVKKQAEVLVNQLYATTKEVADTKQEKKPSKKRVKKTEE